MLTTILSAALLAAAATAPATDAKADAKTMEQHEHGPAPTNPLFEKLKTLQGEWESKMPEGTSHISYHLASNGTVLVETVASGTDHEMITVYHPDKDAVLMTHYCAAGNQPRMRAKKLEGNKLVFSFVDVTNADAKKGGFMGGLTLTFKDADHAEATWTMKGEKGEMPFTFALERVKPQAASGG